MNRAAIIAALLGAAWIAAGAEDEKAGATQIKFDFGSGKIAPDCTPVLPATIYSKELGYGFEPGATIVSVDRGGDDPLREDYCTSDRPFFFSVKLPEGNYRVTVTLGDADGESVTTIKSELRRLALEQARTERGEFITRTFTVSVRTPKISTGGEVRLKERERTMEWADWDEKLTLEFNDTHPCVCAIQITRADDLPTIYLLGDSTVCDQPREPYASWGQMLPRFFKPEVVVANHAESGESLKSSLSAGRLDKVLSTMRAGDYLFIQYGHNDMKERGAGVGAFTTYKADLKRFVAAARQRGGLPVLITPMHRRTFDDAGRIRNSHGDYPEAVRQTAREENVPLIDLHAMSAPFYEALERQGKDFSKQAFAPGDGTHHNNYGSYELARCVIEGIKSAQPGLVEYLAEDARPAFNPGHPDAIDKFKLPPSPQAAASKPDGN